MFFYTKRLGFHPSEEELIENDIFSQDLSDFQNSIKSLKLDIKKLSKF